VFAVDENEFLFKLSSSFGVSGREYNLDSLLGEYFNKYCDEIKHSKTGDFYAIKRGSGCNRLKVMVEAHADEIGLVVTYIDDRGFVHFGPVGGVDPKTLPAQEVVIHSSREVFGVIGAAPPHVLAKEESERVVKIKEMVIDVGMSKEEAVSVISPGDFITVRMECRSLLGDYVTGKALDNRAGICSMYECARRLNEAGHTADVYFAATTMEEIGHIGARVMVDEIVPDIAISIDVTFAERYEDGEGDGCGKGVEIAVGPNIHPELSEMLLKAADENNIKYFIEAYPGNTGTNAWDIQIMRDGIPTLLISIPIRYMHSPTEIVKYEDIKTAGRLTALFISSLKGWDDIYGA
jgi:Cellulase M and related proteins